MRPDARLLESIGDGLDELADLLRAAPLVLPAHAENERERVRIVEGIGAYLRPRLASIEAPVVAAVVGPTGTGKSTIVNSLAQELVSEAGYLRPTTRAPVLWAHSQPSGDHLVEFVARVEERVGPGTELVVGNDPLTAHVTMIDTPPVDLAGAGGNSIVRDVLEVADICIFVTSPARYADAIGWDFVSDARARGVPTIFVFNRLPEDEATADSLLADLAVRLFEHELLLAPDPTMIFPVGEGDVDWHQGLETASVAHLRNELGELADPAFRSSLMMQTALTTAVALAERADALAAAFEGETKAYDDLARSALDAFAEQAAILDAELQAGVLAAVAEREVWLQAAADFAAVVTRRAGLAGHAAAVAWAAQPLGTVLLERDGRGLWRHGDAAARDASEALDDFAAEVVTLARERRRGGLRYPRWASRASDALWRLAVDPSRERTRALHRRYGEDLEPLIGTLRSRLAGLLAERVRADGHRYREHLGEPPGADHAERIADAAHRLLTLARSAVPHRPRVEDPIPHA